MANAETRIAILATLLMMTLAAPSDAQTHTVFGQAGILGEWELTAILTQETEGGRWKGPLSLKHVGFCSADGPEEKTGELRLSMSVPPSEATATLGPVDKPVLRQCSPSGLGGAILTWPRDDALTG